MLLSDLRSTASLCSYTYLVIDPSVVRFSGPFTSLIESLLQHLRTCSEAVVAVCWSVRRLYLACLTRVFTNVICCRQISYKVAVDKCTFTWGVYVWTRYQLRLVMMTLCSQAGSCSDLLSKTSTLPYGIVTILCAIDWEFVTSVYKISKKFTNFMKFLKIVLSHHERMQSFRIRTTH